MTYIVITPVRNEHDRFAKTVDSVVSQTIRPAYWVIVDDGSTDETGAVADSAAKAHSWIRVVHRPDRGSRKQGGGVIEAFYDGFALIVNQPWDFLVKLDGDLSLQPDYFEKCFARFAADDRLGIGGGRIDMLANGRSVEEAPGDPKFHVRGATKIYRRAAWDAIGGIVRATGWDTLDEVKANMLGWRTYSFKDLSVLQLKATGSADGDWRTWIKNGLANYITGYHPLFMACKCLRRTLSNPFGLEGPGLWFGFLKGYFKRIPQVEDRAMIRYLRHQQWRALTFRSSLWNRVANR